MRRGRVGTALVLTGLAAAAAGVVVATVAVPVPVPAGLAAGQAPTVVDVTRQSFTDERTVEVSFEVEPDQDLEIRAAGTVTWSGCVVGSPLDSGTAVLRLDERPLLALHTEVPLFRDLGPGDRGSDVEALQQELARLGFSVTADGRYGRSTTAAVRQLRTDAGVSRPDGTLTPADVLWLPAGTVVPSSCTAVPGATLVEQDPVATVAGGLTGLTLPVPADLHPGARTLTLFGATAQLPEVTGRVDDPAFLAAVAATREFAVVRASTEGPGPNGVLALADPVDALKVPPTALIGIDGGAGCVQQDGDLVPVTLIGSGLGASLVRPSDPSATLTRVAVGAGVTYESCSDLDPSDAPTPPAPVRAETP